ncbi:MAG: PEGA domain-containing protein [Defluviitaleaceae bacterium]|nr:PEGA domain-containing protein [Defluviitaleaceae bacterium]
MSDNRPHDDYDEFESYDDYDNFKYDNYDDDFSLTRDDEAPLTSVRSVQEYDEEPIENDRSKSRSQTRRETIQRLSEEQQNGISRKPGVTAPDPRIDTLRGMANGRPNKPAPRQPRATSGGANTGNRRTPANAANRPPQKTKFAMFYIAFLLLAISVCLVVLVVVLPSLGGRIGDIIGGTLPTPPPVEEERSPRQNLRTLTALVTRIDISENVDTLELLDINERRSQEYTVPDDAIITGRNNRVMIFDELRVGDIIDIRYNSQNFEIRAITENSRRWERVNRQNAHINMDERTVLLNNEVWQFNSQTLVLHNGEDFSIGQIRPYDSVTLAGFGDTVWLVRVETAHGFLQFHNIDRIDNGFVMIGSDQYINFETLEEAEDITLPEGMHHIMVDGDNIEPFIQNIRISQGQTTRINLMDAELLTSQLFFVVTPESAQIFINGEEHINTEPASAEFGEVLIRVELEGYHPQEQEFEINAEMMTFVFDLEEIVIEEPGGTLVISTFPPGAVIYINNEYAGVSPLTQTVPPGVYSVIARSPGHESAAHSISVTGNETSNIERTLVLMPVTSDPFANQPQQPAEPLPTAVPFPTIPPHIANPFPTIPPQTSEPDPFNPFPTTPPVNPEPTPAPDEDVPWWIRLPGY